MLGDHGPGVSQDEDDWWMSDGRLRDEPPIKFVNTICISR